MRQGPDYGMWIRHVSSEYHTPLCDVPWELAEEFDGSHVTWHDNKDGTYTLTPHKE